MFRFFIDRPIFASVISIVIVLAGAAAIQLLAVEAYPEVAPPQIVVTAAYPGASSEVMAESVTAPLEQEINGVDDMLYIESTSTDAGYIQVVVTFAIGTDPDQAAINVNNRVQAALPRMPEIVRTMGVRVQARSTNILMMATLYSPDERYDGLFMSNYALLNVIDDLVRVPGVGDASLFGSQDYSMRIWLSPDMLAQYDLTAPDIAAVLRDQNAQFAAGSLGAEPAPAGQPFTVAVSTEGQLSSVEEFEQLVVRADEDGSVLRLGDVARVELGASGYAFSAELAGQESAPIGIYLQPGANALETAQRVRETMEEVAQRFPAGLAYTVPFDTTEFIETSVREVSITLLVALLLVMFITYLFLQHLRATLIPLAAIPVSLIGTFAGMQALGFSINLLTLFGLVLAIGIVVDNAIIVMENVERLMREQGMRAREAAIETVRQVAGAVVSSTLVVVAVFIPVAFLGGMAGELYRQFAVTIAVSVVVSGVVALTLTPTMCALLLDKQKTYVPAPLRWFNRGFEKVTRWFVLIVARVLRRPVLSVTVFVALSVVAVALTVRLPSALVPPEDQGVVIAVAQLPPTASLQRTTEVRDALGDALNSMPEIEDFSGMAGFDIIAGSLRTNALMGFASLTDWSERRGPGQDAASIAQRVMGMGFQMQEANVFAFTPPPIMGLSLTGGVEGYIQVRGDRSLEDLEALALRFVAAANARPELTGVRTTLETGIPQFHATVDRDQAHAMQVPIRSIFDVMQSTFGSLYVNDFTYNGRNWQVNLQSEGEYRSEPDDLRRVFVRSQTGELVPLSSLVTLERVTGTDIVNRFNVSLAARVMGDPAPGYTSGDAKAAMEAVADEILDQQSLLGWMGEAYQLDAASAAGGLSFGLGLLMVFLILAAQYERLTLPLAVATAVPFGVLGAALGATLRGMPNDIYFQVGLLLLIGLAAKNAILIVEFAAQNRAGGMSSRKAAMEAARQRFRAIMMTASTFIVGMLPLVFATGAGAASRQAIGTAVVAGMVVASTLALVFVALFYSLLEDWSSRARRGESKHA